MSKTAKTRDLSRREWQVMEVLHREGARRAHSRELIIMPASLLAILPTVLVVLKATAILIAALLVSLAMHRARSSTRHHVWLAALDGLPTERAFGTNTHVQFANRMWLRLGGTYNVGDRYCDRTRTRGGPALRVGPRFAPWGSIEGDDRHAIVPSIGFRYTTHGGRSNALSLNASVRYKVGSRFSTSLSANLSRNQDEGQWFGNPVDASGTTHYTFAALDQRTLGVM